MPKHHMITPIPNMNGNSKESLLLQLRTILDTMRDLEDTIAKASDLWHGRNYQTMRDGDIMQRRAMDAWMERRTMLHDFHKEVMEMAIEMQQFA